MANRIIGNIIENYKNEYNEVPKKKNLFKWANDLLNILFPLHQPEESALRIQLEQNRSDFYFLMIETKKNRSQAKELTRLFYDNLYAIHQDLLKDADEFLNNDPAAKCMGEVLHTYPGFYAISIYRIAHLIHKTLKIEYIPRMLTEYAHGKTGIDIHPGAEIKAPFLIDHGTGVVIGETCKIGKHVSLYQGVTLGALQVDKEMQNTKRHPTIEDHVVIYANATILGGNTTIGNHSVIGGNVFLTKSVEPYSLVHHKLETKIKNINTETKNINFII
ncbi:serine acetyltransferase [Flavobacteriaceae bacterium Ap0902]|nr:serine acetyltransferase [Flavobacteriaceae bacterium Ap0902]